MPGAKLLGNRRSIKINRKGLQGTYSNVRIRETGISGEAYASHFRRASSCRADMMPSRRTFIWPLTSAG